MMSELYNRIMQHTFMILERLILSVVDNNDDKV